LTRYYLGLDGGQSSTTILIADETGRVLGRGRGGPCNHVSGDIARAKFFLAVGDALREACEQANLSAADIEFESVCLGFSGGAADKDAYSREFLRSKQYKITHDAEIALSGATGGEPGIIIIAGTGSMAFGRDAAGVTGRAGGWGYVFGDEGGGFDITRRALRAALRFEEGWGPATSLHRMLLAETGSATANSLMHLFYTPEFSRPQVAALSKVVNRAAELGDGMAAEILRAAAAELMTYVDGVYRQLFTNGEHPVIAHIGGVFQSEIVRLEFCRLAHESTGSEPTPPRFGPAAGALLEALRADGNQCPLSSVPKWEK
jgi:N-acetylglucosamine kinase-like BadF-type ATPase